jgi:hypothetical protein
MIRRPAKHCDTTRPEMSPYSTAISPSLGEEEELYHKLRSRKLISVHVRSIIDRTYTAYTYMVLMGQSKGNLWL